MLRVHFGAHDSADDDIGRLARAVASLGGSFQPLLVIGRHQYELAPAMRGNLDGLTRRFMLKMPEFALEFEGANDRHGGYV